MPRVIEVDKSDADASSEEDSSLTDKDKIFVQPQRQIDPGDPDIYTDAILGPLFLRFKRAARDSRSGPRFSDYSLVTSFLIFNFALQLAIAYKIIGLTESEYSDYAEDLFADTCYKVDASMDAYYNELLTPERKQKAQGTYDCVQPAVIATLAPERLDLNNDGFWSLDEAEKTRENLLAFTEEVGDFSYTLEAMIEYDNRTGFTGNRLDQLNLSFFTRNRGSLTLCAAGDPNLCGNLEKDGHLASIYSHPRAVKRVADCREMIEKECPKIYGEMFQFIKHKTNDLCGSAHFSFESGVNVVSYGRVETYVGEPDSVVGKPFVSFLIMVLFVWVLIMLQEAREIWEVFCVVWAMPSTTEEDPNFASISEDGKMQVKKLPFGHKAYSLILVVICRTCISWVVFLVGVKFLSTTDNLMDLVLNSTALGFLVEVDNMIHMAFLGHTFTRAITERCEAMTVPFNADHATRSPWFYLAVVGVGLGSWIFHLYRHPHGLNETAIATACLCHLKGPCLAKMLMDF